MPNHNPRGKHHRVSIRHLHLGKQSANQPLQWESCFLEKRLSRPASCVRRPAGAPTQYSVATWANPPEATENSGPRPHRLDLLYVELRGANPREPLNQENQEHLEKQRWPDLICRRSHQNLLGLNVSPRCLPHGGGIPRQPTPPSRPLIC